MVADSNNWAHLAAIADNVWVDNGSLSLFLSLFVLIVKFSILFLGEFRGLLLDKLVNLVNKLTLELSGSVAAAARVSLAVLGAALALGALNEVRLGDDLALREVLLENLLAFWFLVRF